MTYLFKSLFHRCPRRLIAAIIFVLIGVSHSAWVVFDQPLATLSEIIGVNTFWFEPWLVVGGTFLMMWAEVVRTLRLAR